MLAYFTVRPPPKIFPSQEAESAKRLDCSEWEVFVNTTLNGQLQTILHHISIT